MGTPGLVGIMGVYVVAGFPLVWYLWETLNEVLSGQFDGLRLLGAIAAAPLLLGLLILLARAVQRWDRMDED
jgi:hypothetical protein